MKLLVESLGGQGEPVLGSRQLWEYNFGTGSLEQEGIANYDTGCFLGRVEEPELELEEKAKAVISGK